MVNSIVKFTKTDSVAKSTYTKTMANSILKPTKTDSIVKPTYTKTMTNFTAIPMHTKTMTNSTEENSAVIIPVLFVICLLALCLATTIILYCILKCRKRKRNR